MLKVKEPFIKCVMTGGLTTLKHRIYEEFGISKQVDMITEDFINTMCSFLNDTQWGIPQNPNIKECHFEYKFWNISFNVKVFLKNYSTGNACLLAKECGNFDSKMNFKDRILELSLGAVKGLAYSSTFDDIIKHEIQHIYITIHGGDIKPSDKLLNNLTMFNEEFYNKLNNIILQTKDVKIRKIAYGLYSSFEFERNGFIGGLDGVFLEMPNDEPDISYMQNTEHNRIRKLQSTGCYKAYENIIKVLNFIDDVSDDKIYNAFGYYKYKIKKVLEISKERYLKGMSKIIMKYSNIWGNERTLLKKIREGYNMGRFNTFTWIL